MTSIDIRQSGIMRFRDALAAFVSLVLCALVSLSCSDADGAHDGNSQPMEAADTSAPLVLLVFGLPPQGANENAREVVAERWGIGFRRIAGCNISTAQWDSAEKNNRRVAPQIETRFGSDWREKFNKEVEQESEIQKTVLEMLQPLLKRELRRINGGRLWMRPLSGTTRYAVTIDRWENELVPYLTLQVDHITGEVDSIHRYNSPGDPISPSFR